MSLRWTLREWSSGHCHHGLLSRHRKRGWSEAEARLSPRFPLPLFLPFHSGLSPETYLSLSLNRRCSSIDRALCCPQRDVGLQAANGISSILHSHFSNFWPTPARSQVQVPTERFLTRNPCYPKDLILRCFGSCFCKATV